MANQPWMDGTFERPLQRLRQSNQRKVHIAAVSVKASQINLQTAMKQRQNSTPNKKKIAATKALPKNWPSGLTYLPSPVYATTLSKAELTFLREPSPQDSTPPPTGSSPFTLVKIQIIAGPPTHPALNQHGLFATRQLPPGSFILDYLGVYHSETSTSDYDLSLSREFGIGIDAVTMGNEARFINDHRGIRARGPNAEFRERAVDGERRMGVFVLPTGKSGKGKGIGKGEEICVSYGKGFWKGRQAEREADYGMPGGAEAEQDSF